MTNNMKLSFSIPSNSSSKAKKPVGQSDDDNTKQYVTEFDPTKTLQGTRTPVIQPIENEYQPHKKMKNIDLLLHPDTSTDLRFERRTLSSDSPDSMSFGLNLRQPTVTSLTKEARVEDVMLEKLRHDLKRLPEDRGFEEFGEMPVEDFAKALLKGYGWHEGRGVGKNAKEDVKIKQYTKRTDKEGLGFFSASLDSKNSNSGSVGYSVKENESERNKDGFSVGKEVRLIFGKKENLGLKGTIVKRLGSDLIVLRVERAGIQFLFFMGSIRELMGIWFKGTWTERLGLCRIMVAMSCLISNSSKLQNMLEIPATLAIDSLCEYCRHPRWRDLPQFKDQKQHIISHFQWKREIREVKLPV